MADDLTLLDAESLAVQMAASDVVLSL